MVLYRGVCVGNLPCVDEVLKAGDVPHIPTVRGRARSAYDSHLAADGGAFVSTTTPGPDDAGRGVRTAR